MHCIEGQTRGENAASAFDFKALHAAFGGEYIGNNSYDRRLAINAIKTGYADMIAFGRPFIGNPDLVERLRRNAPLVEANHATFYGGGAKGYTDYKTFDQTVAAKGGCGPANEIRRLRRLPLVTNPNQRRPNMTQVYFHCSNIQKVFVDYRGAVVDDLAEARDHATRVVQSFTNERSLEDWHDWVLHASDDQGDQLFVVPFTFVFSKPH